MKIPRIVVIALIASVFLVEIWYYHVGYNDALKSKYQNKSNHHIENSRVILQGSYDGNIYFPIDTIYINK